MAETHLDAIHIASASTFDGALTVTGALNTSAGTLNAGGTLGVVRINASGTVQTFGTQQLGWGAGVPGAGTWYTGNVIFNTAPTAGGAVGWACTAGGTTGGTWKAFGTLAA